VRHLKLAFQIKQSIMAIFKYITLKLLIVGSQKWTLLKARLSSIKTICFFKCSTGESSNKILNNSTLYALTAN
jgi:hypothetical protein